MIPKIIHYCWFGHSPKPKLAEKCIKSWKRFCPDYEIIEWNEDNYNISVAPLYVRQAYEAKKWAFVTDYVRLQVVYENGGIYLDTDVELKKKLDVLLEYGGYFGFENGNYVNTGLGFGAEKGLPILKEMMDDYVSIPFLLPNGGFDTKTCPVRNTEVFLRHGLQQDDSRQILTGNVLILPSEYLCPLSYTDGKKIKSKNTVSVHWFSASWQTQEQAKAHKRNVNQVKRKNLIHNISHFPNRALMAILGTKHYEMLKSRLKK